MEYCLNWVMNEARPMMMILSVLVNLESTFEG